MLVEQACDVVLRLEHYFTLSIGSECLLLLSALLTLRLPDLLR